MNEIAFPASFKEKVTETLRESIGKLLPDESLRLLVEKEIEAYFTADSTSFVIETHRNDSYNYRDTATQVKLKGSPLRAQVWGELHKRFDKMIQETLDSDPSALEADYSSTRVTEKVKEFTKEIALEMASKVFESIVQSATNNALSAMRTATVAFPHNNI